MNDFSGFRDILALGGILLGIAFIALLIGLVVYILYINTLYTTLKAVSPQNRRMDPGLAWLLLIPLVSTVFYYFLMNAIAESLEAEYRSRGIHTQPKPTYNIGITYFILGITGLAISVGQWFSILPRLTAISFLLGLAGLIIWIIYWVQVAQERSKLRNTIAMSSDSQIF